VAVGADLPGGEEVRGGDLLDLAPVVAVGAEGDVGGKKKSKYLDIFFFS
jgi:hypothetical protein